MGRLDGKTALITGTGGGQGRVAALRFAKEGAQVFACDVNASGAHKTAAMVESDGGRILSAAPVDLSDPLAVRRWVDSAVEACGRIDVLYNNASNQVFAPVAEMSPDDWQFTMHNDLDLVFYTCRYSWKHMVAGGGGSIINIASVSGMRGNMTRETVGHSTAKAGILGATMQLAAEGARHNIRVNAISPGIVATAVNHEFLASDEGQHVVAQVPLGRPASAEDVVNAAVFLATDEANYITGANIVVDGGLTAVF